MKEIFHFRLKYQFLALVFVGLILPVSAVLLFQINLASESNKQNRMEMAVKTGEQISNDLETMNQVLYDVSKIYANSVEVLLLLANDYQGNDPLKRSDMRAVKNIFMSRSAFPASWGIGGIYTNQGELFNLYMDPERRVHEFYDPVPPEVLLWIEQFQVNSPEKLGKIYWYSLQPNLFQEKETGNPRRDHILFGSRRTFNLVYGNYLSTHLFIIPEQEIYDQYKGYLLEEGQQIFILDHNKRLISGSDEAYVGKRQLTKELLARLESDNDKDTHGGFLLSLDGVEKLVSFWHSAEIGWYTVIITPSATATGPFWQLFRNVMMAVFFILLLFFGAVIIFSHYIVMPLKELILSMSQVEKGNFALIPGNHYRNEIGQIIFYHNHMVSQLEQLFRDIYEKEKQSRELEGKVLMGQMNPHFIYNTLDTIVWRARQAGYPDIADVAIKLGQFLRSSVRNGTTTTTLAEEIRQTMLYVEIQQIRFKERMNFTILPFDKELEDFRVLSLILQPALENALVHGMRSGGIPIHITVSITKREDGLRIEISDDGAGMDQERLQTVINHMRGRVDAAVIPSSSTGIGMRNIQERIDLYFGSGYGLEVSSVLGKGTTVCLCLPLLPKEAKGEKGIKV